MNELDHVSLDLTFRLFVLYTLQVGAKTPGGKHLVASDQLCNLAARMMYLDMLDTTAVTFSKC